MVRLTLARMLDIVTGLYRKGVVCPKCAAAIAVEIARAGGS